MQGELLGDVADGHDICRHISLHDAVTHRHASNDTPFGLPRAYLHTSQVYILQVVTFITSVFMRSRLYELFGLKKALSFCIPAVFTFLRSLTPRLSPAFFRFSSSSFLRRFSLLSSSSSSSVRLRE